MINIMGVWGKFVKLTRNKKTGKSHFSSILQSEFLTDFQPPWISVVGQVCPTYKNSLPTKTDIKIQHILKKREVFRTSLNWLGRKDSNLRDGWTKTSCLTTWRRPIAITILQYQDLMSRIIFQYIKSSKNFEV